MFDHFYPILYGCPSPYTTDGMAGTEPLYEIPEAIFEDVVTAHFKADREKLRSKTAYLPGSAAYQYRPRGFYEAFTNRIVVRPFQDGSFRYLSNSIGQREMVPKVAEP